MLLSPMMTSSLISLMVQALLKVAFNRDVFAVQG